MPNITFPMKIATGNAFCNRSIEKERLKTNIEHKHHSLLISPRRYGKTSLVFTVAEELKLPFAHTQFLNALKYETITNRLIYCLSDLMQQVLTPSQKTLKLVQSFFTRIRISLKISHVDMEFQLEPLDKNPEKIILALLTGIEKLLENKKQSVIIFLDEFQDIAIVDTSDDLQSILRDFAQQTQYISFIISGSNRKLLESMFMDRNKPFYKLFDHIKLMRIESKHYLKFLKKKAKQRWDINLENNVIEQILSLTENHAYYTNRLCDQLWQQKTPPILASVNEHWDSVIQSEFDTIAEDLSHLSKNQRIVLQVFAQEGFVTEPSSSTMISKINLAHGSILNAVANLNKLDYIEKTSQGYRVIDPAMKCVLQM